MMILASQGILGIEIVASEDSKNYFLRESAQCLHSFENIQKKARLIRAMGLNGNILLPLSTVPIHTYKHICIHCIILPLNTSECII